MRYKARAMSEPADDIPRTSMRTRLEGHGILIALVAIAIFAAVIRAQGPHHHFNYLALFVGVFPVVIGWIIGVLALERGLRSEDGRRAIGIAVGAGAVAALVNLVLVIVLLDYLGVT
jgi:uncharacterized membrane protein